MNIDKFIKDHESIFTAISNLRNLMGSGTAEYAAAISKLVMDISSVIKLHLAAEDNYLYPAMIKSSNAEAVQLGKKYQTEMGTIAKAYMDFVGRWNIASKIAANPDGFKTDANAIFKALHHRIQNENKELYPVAELL